VASHTARSSDGAAGKGARTYAASPLGRPTGTARSGLEQSLLYSEELGIDLASGREPEYFRWFLASLLFGARIAETTAKNTYRSFLRHGLDTPEAILEAGWDFLVYPVMREGGYVRYDGRKSTQVLRDCETLVTDYGGKVSGLRDAARATGDLERRLLAFYGVGPVTTNIFLRELRPFWANADPAPLPLVEQLAQRCGVDLKHYDRKSLVFARVEAGLLRRRRMMASRGGL